MVIGPIATLKASVNTLSDLTTMHKAALEGTTTEVHDQVNLTSEGIEKAVVVAIQKSNQQQANSQAAPRGSDGQPTYAEAAKAGTPTQLTRILARSEAQTCQILIDRRSIFSPNFLKDLTEAQLVLKAAMALELMEQQNIEYPKELSFISTRRLPHGRVLYELNLKTSAEWFNIAANKSNFLEFYSTNVIIKDRSYHVLMESAPVSFVPDNPAAIADIEKKAGLPPRSIIKTRYIKPIARRNLNQRTVHIAIMFATKEGANQAIKFGLSIAGKKCQSFDGNHVAAECPQTHDTCGTCGEEHHTQNCKMTKPESYSCANCKEKGHTSWSRECPIFTQKWESHKRRNDEAKHIYFPTEDPLTWEPVPNAQTDWSNVLTPNLTDHQQIPQQNKRYPPPQHNRQDWHTVGSRKQQTQHHENPQNLNNIPLGHRTQTQTRLTDRHVDKPTPAQPMTQQLLLTAPINA
ncbi:hypothetical protein EDD22DRAFT_959806 [Suillus occidentalis]|nr:hypothetical protein EDD22DRAFT_959806 [Suillus occidentalis]